jgi:acetate kinase
MAEAATPVLCINAGSSSLKLALFEVGDGERRLAGGAVERIGLPEGRLRLSDSRDETVVDSPGRFADGESAVHAALEALDRLALAAPAAVGHRIVHGGPDHVAPEGIDACLLAALRDLVPFAPLHLPPQIDAIEAVARRRPGVPQVACFDTAFHCRLPSVARRFPLPRVLQDAGIRRYGFHGLSYEYVVAELGAVTLGRAVIAHLGNGASMAAIRDGEPVDTTMGLTPTGGLMMGTRSGDLDPGILVYLARKGYDAAALEQVVDRESGLLGVSGITSDMKTLLARRADDVRAREAVESFCYQVRKQVGALAAVLGGLDVLVFTGGIGERAAPVRWEACQGLGHLGILLDAQRNDRHDAVISTPGSACTVRVVPTDEDRMIARHTRAVLAGGRVR